MFHFSFSGSNNFEVKQLYDLELFVNSNPNFQSVYMNNDKELEVFLELIGLQDFNWIQLQNAPFIKYADISNYKFPEMDDVQYQKFFELWISKSKREHNIDEWANFIFLSGGAKEFNKRSTRVLLLEENK